MHTKIAHDELLRQAKYFYQNFWKTKRIFMISKRAGRILLF
jgi:hypothetical protein